MAAAVLANRASEIDSPEIIVTSSGTSGWHVGEGAHPLSEKTWKGAGYKHHHQARQFNATSFSELDLILAMDESNYSNLIALASNEEERQKVVLLRSFDSEADSREVPDPWGEEIEAYQRVLAMIEGSISGLLQALQK